MSSWPMEHLLPEIFAREEMEERESSDRKMKEMRDRIDLLESKLTRQQLAGPIGMYGLEMTPNVIMFGLVVGLVVYLLATAK